MLVRIKNIKIVTVLLLLALLPLQTVEAASKTQDEKKSAAVSAALEQKILAEQVAKTEAKESIEEMKYGAWMSPVYSNFSDENPQTSQRTKTYQVIMGGDYKINDMFISGLTVIHEDSKTNIMSSGPGNGLSSKGYTMAPYGAIIFNSHVFVDLLAGYGFLSKGTIRTSNITGSSKSNRILGSIGLTLTNTVNNFVMSVRTATMYVCEREQSYIESDGTYNRGPINRSANASILGRVGYLVDGKWKPYIEVGGDYNTQTSTLNYYSFIGTTPAAKKRAYNAGCGIEFQGSPWSGSLGFNRSNGHGSTRNDTFSLNIRRVF